MKQRESWAPVLGFEGRYEVSTIGNVRSLVSGGILLKPWKHKHGYPMVALRKDGKTHTRLVHVLMLEAFKGARPAGKNGLHANDVPDDNRIGNLRWGTQKENMRDIVRNGNHDNANKTHCPLGHEYTPKNTRTYFYNGTPRRYCIACNKIRSQRHYQKSKEKR